MADEWREQGNAAFRASDFARAVTCFSKAIETDSANATLYSNRSVAYLRLNDAKAALADAERCIELRPDWEKAWFRKGAALEAAQPEQALQAFQAALQLQPGSAELTRKVQELTRRVGIAAAGGEGRDAGKGAGGSWKSIGTGAPKPLVRQLQEWLRGTRANVERHTGAMFAGLNPLFQQMSGGMLTARLEAQCEAKELRKHLPGGRPPPPAAWARGLSAELQYEWLTDVYRLRLDEEYVFDQDVGLGSLYDPSADRGSVLAHFLAFCRLAVAAGALPLGWDWPAFLAAAAPELCYAFEKSDAEEKYGAESVMLLSIGGRSLRHTAEVIYGTSLAVQPGEEGAVQPAHVEAVVDECLGRGGWAALQRDPALFDRVGGVGTWRAFYDALPQPKRA